MTIFTLRYLEERKAIKQKSKELMIEVRQKDKSDHFIGNNREMCDIAIAILDTTLLSSFVAEICKVCKITKLCEIQPLLI